VRVIDDASIKESLGWDPGLWIYDAYTPEYGGSGVQAPWSLIAAQAERPFLLAGGLTPDNVAEAIRATRPDGVDVASGVEAQPGVKDPAKVAAFVAAARGAAGSG
jgi:phosphoribosylanthranilate isomerase